MCFELKKKAMPFRSQWEPTTSNVNNFASSISVATGVQGDHIPQIFFAYLVVLCFDRRCPKQNIVARLKSTYLSHQKILGWLRHWLQGIDSYNFSLSLEHLTSTETYSLQAFLPAENCTSYTLTSFVTSEKNRRCAILRSLRKFRKSFLNLKMQLSSRRTALTHGKNWKLWKFSL